MSIAISLVLAAVDHTDTAALETALAQTALGLVGVREEFEADYMATLATMERDVGGLVSLEQIQDAVNAAHDVVATRNAGVACSANFKVVDGGCVACPNERVHDAGTDPLEGDTFCVQPVPNVDSYGDAQVTAVDVLCVAVDCATADMDAIEALGCFDALAQLRLQGSVDTSKYVSLYFRSSLHSFPFLFFLGGGGIGAQPMQLLRLLTSLHYSDGLLALQVHLLCSLHRQRCLLRPKKT